LIVEAAAADRDKLVGCFSMRVWWGIKIDPHEWGSKKQGSLRLRTVKVGIVGRQELLFAGHAASFVSADSKYALVVGVPILGYGVPGDISTICCQSLLAAWKKKRSLTYQYCGKDSPLSRAL
jgi:hypothetical protein